MIKESTGYFPKGKLIFPPLQRDKGLLNRTGPVSMRRLVTNQPRMKIIISLHLPLYWSFWEYLLGARHETRAEHTEADTTLISAIKEKGSNLQSSYLPIWRRSLQHSAT